MPKEIVVRPAASPPLRGVKKKTTVVAAEEVDRSVVGRPTGTTPGQAGWLSTDISPMYMCV